MSLITTASSPTQNASPWFEPRHAAPVAAPGEMLWTVTRYADAMAVLRNSAMGPQEPWTEIIRLGERLGRDFGGLVDLLQAMMFSPSHPDHPKLRQLFRQMLAKLGPCFSPEATEAVVRDRLAAARRVGRVDAMEAVCRAIPTTIMSDALGLRPETVAAIRAAVGSIFAIYVPGLPLRQLNALESDALAAEAAILDELARARTGQGGGLAILVALNEAGPGFSDRALAGYVFFLMFAGVESLTGLLGSMILLLHLHPQVRETVHADRRLIAPCVEEMIRFAGPLRWTAPRIASADSELAGRAIRRGAMLLVELEQAHRDPAVYDRPELFDLTREGPPNIGFGLGANACLGAAIGRSEARIFLDAVLDGDPITPVDAVPEWEPHILFRRLSRLHASFAP